MHHCAALRCFLHACGILRRAHPSQRKALSLSIEANFLFITGCLCDDLEMTCNKVSGKSRATLHPCTGQALHVFGQPCLTTQVMVQHGLCKKTGGGQGGQKKGSATGLKMALAYAGHALNCKNEGPLASSVGIGSRLGPDGFPDLANILRLGTGLACALRLVRCGKLTRCVICLKEVRRPPRSAGRWPCSRLTPSTADEMKRHALMFAAA